MTQLPSDLRKRDRSGRDRPEWTHITIYCCGDCGWRSFDDKPCEGCGEPLVPVQYSRPALDEEQA